MLISMSGSQKINVLQKRILVKFMRYIRFGFLIKRVRANDKRRQWPTAVSFTNPDHLKLNALPARSDNYEKARYRV